MPKPAAQDMQDAKLLYVKLKINYTKNPQLTSLDGLKYVLGDGGATEAWAKLPGLRHKYFVYNEETSTCSGVYVFFDQASLDAYMASDMFKAQGTYPHVSEVTAEVHDVMVGTEKAIENYGWAHTPPTREDVSKAWMIIAHLKVKTDVTPEPALREFVATQYTEMFNKDNGPKGLRGKYFTYNSDMETVSGFYTFLDKASMEAYLASDLWKGQASAPNIAGVTFSTHEVLPGTERAIDLGCWKGSTPAVPSFIDSKFTSKTEYDNWVASGASGSSASMQIELGYFDLQAAPGEQIRLALKIYGIPFKDTRIQFQDWPKIKPTMPYGTLPYMIVDGEFLVQSGSLIRWVGQLGDGSLYPCKTDPLMCRKIEEFEGLADDLNRGWYPLLTMGMGAHTKFGYPEEWPEKDEVNKKLRAKFVENDFKQIMSFLTAALEKTGAFLCGPKPTIADLRFVPFIDYFHRGVADHMPKAGEILKPYPTILAYIERFKALPELKGHYKGEYWPES